jgi:hypothetical protein
MNLPIAYPMRDGGRIGWFGRQGELTFMVG